MRLQKAIVDELSGELIKKLSLVGVADKTAEEVSYKRSRILVETEFKTTPSGETFEVSVNCIDTLKGVVAEVGAVYPVVDGVPFIRFDKYYVVMGVNNMKMLWTASTPDTTAHDVYNKIGLTQPRELKAPMIWSMQLLERIVLSLKNDFESWSHAER